MMLVNLSFVPLILNRFDLVVQLVHLPLSYHLILPLILFGHVSLVFFYLFLQRGKYSLLLFHLVSDTPPLGHHVFLLSL